MKTKHLLSLTAILAAVTLTGTAMAGAPAHRVRQHSDDTVMQDQRRPGQKHKAKRHYKSREQAPCPAPCCERGAAATRGKAARAERETAGPRGERSRRTEQRPSRTMRENRYDSDRSPANAQGRRYMRGKRQASPAQEAANPDAVKGRAAPLQD